MGGSHLARQEYASLHMLVSYRPLRRPTRPVDAARESARHQFEEKQGAQRRAHLLILAHRLLLFSTPSEDGVPGC